MIRSLAVKKHLIIMTLLFCLINITAQHPSNVYRFGIHGSATYNNYFRDIRLIQILKQD
jgi:hypothetical protein